MVEEEYVEEKVINFDNRLRLSGEVLRVSGLVTGDTVVVKATKDSGVVVITKKKVGEKRE